MSDEAAKALSDFDAHLSSLTKAADEGLTAEKRLAARDAQLISEMQSFLDQLATKMTGVLGQSWKAKLQDGRVETASETSKLRIVLFRDGLPHVIADCVIYAGYFQIVSMSPNYVESTKRIPEDLYKGLSAFMSAAVARK